MDLLNAMDNFLLACRAEGKQPKTVRSYHDSIKDFINHHGNVELSEITVSDVRNHLISLSERPGRYGSFSTHSSMKHFSVLRTWFRWMKREGFCEVGMETIKPPRTSKKLPSHLLDDEVLLLFRRLRDKGNFRDTLIFELFLDSGLRLNEVVNLDLKDVNIDGGWVKVVGKGDKEDIVPIGNQVSRDLHTYIHIHRKARDGEKALFVNQSGFRLAYEGLSGMVRRELSQIRTEGKRGAHTMRHTFATNYLRGNNGKRGNLEELRRILRHTDIKVTQIYTHLADDDILRAHRELSPVDALRRKMK